MTENGWPVLAMPFLIVSLWILVGGIGLVFLAIKGFELPDYFSANVSLNKNMLTICNLKKVLVSNAPSEIECQK